MAVDLPQFASADHTASPPHIHIPRDYNASVDLVERKAMPWHVSHRNQEP